MRISTRRYEIKRPLVRHVHDKAFGSILVAGLLLCFLNLAFNVFDACHSVVNLALFGLDELHRLVGRDAIQVLLVFLAQQLLKAINRLLNDEEKVIFLNLFRNDHLIFLCR